MQKNSIANKSLALVLVLVFLISTISVAGFSFSVSAAGNLLVNGDFSVSNTSSADFGWIVTKVEASVSSGTCTVTNGNEDHKAMYQQVTFTPGTTYVLSANFSGVKDVSLSLDGETMLESISNGAYSKEFTADASMDRIEFSGYKASYSVSNVVLMEKGSGTPEPEYTEDFVVVFGDATGMPGETVDVPVTIVKNNGIWGFQFDVEFDSNVFEFTEATGSTINTASNTSYSTLILKRDDSKLSLQSTGVAINANYTYTGLLLTLHFTLKESAAGGAHTINPAFLPNNMIKCDFDEVPSKAVPSTVTVHEHNYTVAYSWNNDNSQCTATATCAGFPDHTVTETANSTSVISAQPTCEGKGTHTYTANFDNALFTTQTKDVEDIPAKNHDYTITYTWSVDNSSCTADAVCKNDASHTATETVATTSTVKTAATCEGKGTHTYSANFTNPIFALQTKDVEDIPVLNHDYTVAYSWTTDGSSCTATATCKNDASHVVTETVTATSVVTIQPTCTEKGTTTYTANFNNALFNMQAKEIQDVPAINHDYTVTYTWAEDGSSCTANGVCKNDPSHVISENASISSYVSKAPTTAAKGETTYEATFTNPVFAKQQKTIEDIDKLVYEYTITYEWAEDGSSCVAYATCSDATQNVQENGSITSALKQAATCEAKGITTFTADFTNPMFERQVTDIANIPALNHDYTITYTWSADNSSCTANAVCKNDASHTVTETVTATSSIKVPATCEGKGTHTYSAIFTNSVFTAQAKDVEDIPALNHDYTITYSWTENGSSCTATATCKNDASHVITETVQSTSAVLTPATVEAKGTTRYTATFTNALFAKQTKDIEDIEKLEPPYTLGDVNGDGDIDMKDVLALRKHIAGMTITGKFIEKAADANEDNAIDMKDVLLIRKYIANLVTKLGK